jgi:hypothetical protein
MRDFYNNNVIASAEWIDNRHIGDREKIIAERPDIVWTEWDEEEISKARKLAKVVWEEKYPGIAGEGGVEALEILLKDIENAKAALGIK